MRKKILLLNLPGLVIDAPPLPLAILKGALNPYHDVTCFDLNYYIKMHANVSDNWLQFFHYNNEKIQSTIKEFFKSHNIFTKEFDYIGISILSDWQYEVCKIVIANIKKYCNSKIVCGGPYFVYTKNNPKKFKFFKENVDACITGDAEIALLEYLNGNYTYPGINTPGYNISFNRDTTNFPDYSDFNLKNYSELQIYQTKGCIRKCTFCTVPSVWPKFVYKSSSRTADEIKYVYDKYNLLEFKNIKRLHFVDSLINGSKKLLEELSAGIISNFGKNHYKFHWGGQAIASSYIPLDIYKLAAQAGLKYMIVGVESGSEKVRWNMKKKFSNEDLIQLLWYCKILKITLHPLMIIGYPTETEQDFQLTLELLEKFKKYGVKNITPGSTHIMTLGYNMPIMENLQHYNISNYKNNWEWTGIDHDYAKRLARLEKFATKAFDLGLTDVDPTQFVNAVVPLSSNDNINSTSLSF